MDTLGAERQLLDEQLAVLAHVKRRRLLRSLLEENPQEVDSAEDEDSKMTSGRRDHVIEMHHRHLPKLEANGYIEWDRGNDVVIKGPQFEEIRPLLELIDAHRDELPVDWT